MVDQDFTPIGQRTEDITGQRFGRWFVLQYVRVLNGKNRWVCRCDCGIQRLVVGYDLQHGKSKSCGCLQQERFSHNHTHGKAGTAIYQRWQNIMNRCYKTNNPDFKYYGGKGIFVDRTWHTFTSFYKDMGDPPTPKHTLERLQNNGPYNKENTVWATRATQAHNTRRNVYVTINGVTKCLSEWAVHYHISVQTIAGRLRLGWSPEKAIIAPVRSHRPCNPLIILNGISQRLTEWIAQYKINQTTFHARLTRGWSVEDAITTSVNTKYGPRHKP